MLVIKKDHWMLGRRIPKGTLCTIVLRADDEEGPAFLVRIAGVNGWMWVRSFNAQLEVSCS